MEIPRHWRLKKQRYALTGETCTYCQAVIFPPRPVCPQCGSGSGRDSVQPVGNALDVSAVLQSAEQVKVIRPR